MKTFDHIPTETIEQDIADTLAEIATMTREAEAWESLPHIGRALDAMNGEPPLCPTPLQEEIDYTLEVRRVYRGR